MSMETPHETTTERSMPSYPEDPLAKIKHRPAAALCYQHAAQGRDRAIAAALSKIALGVEATNHDGGQAFGQRL